MIRCASVDDAEAISRVAKRAFVAAFSDITPPDDMTHYLETALSPGTFASELADHRSTFFVSEALDAYGKLQKGPPPSEVGSAIELQRLYVDPKSQGRGLGTTLLVAMLGHAACANDAIWLGVWEKNERALALYRRFGFKLVGIKPFVIGTDVQQDLVLRASLPAPGTSQFDLLRR